MRKITSLLLATFLVLSSRIADASDTRVDAVGGLTLIMTDESVEITPFTFGNPAGLGILPTQNRFDVAGQWFEQSVAIASTTTHLYGLLNHLGDNGTVVKYHGLILSPVKNWAVQADGDLLHLENNGNDVFDEFDGDVTRGLFRTAYNFGPFVLGGETQIIQLGLAAKPGAYSGSDQVLRGEVTGSALHSTAGLLLSLLGDPTSAHDRFLLGGTFTTQLGTDKVEAPMTVNLPPGNPVDITKTVQVDSLRTFGPDAYFIVPGSFESAVLVRFSDSSSSFKLDSQNTSLYASQPSFKVNDSNRTSLIGIFKATHPLEKGTSLKSGLSITFDSGHSTSFDPSQTIQSEQTNQAWEIQAGVGVEKKDDFTVGLQANMKTDQGTYQLVGNPDAAIDFMRFKLSIGGEKLLSSDWAFRMGFVCENDLDKGETDYDTFYFPISDGQRIITTTISTGLGYKDPSLHLDFLLWYGQPILYDSPLTDAFALQLGVQLAAGFLFK